WFGAPESPVGAPRAEGWASDGWSDGGSVEPGSEACAEAVRARCGSAVAVGGIESAPPWNARPGRASRLVRKSSIGLRTSDWDSAEAAMAVVNSQPSAIGLTIRDHRCRLERGLAAASRARLWDKSGESLTAPRGGPRPFG